MPFVVNEKLGGKHNSGKAFKVSEECQCKSEGLVDFKWDRKFKISSLDKDERK